MKLRQLAQLAFGVATFVPGVNSLHRRGTGGTVTARYCYSVWLRHLVLAHQHGLSAAPDTVAELGPGDSIGIGLAALLTGSRRYFALDVVAHANAERNRRILDELIELFRNATPIPGPDEFPLVKPELSDYRFPSDILTPERMAAALDPARIAKLKKDLADGGPDAMMSYKVPWHQHQAIDGESVDMVYSQAVLEHVDDLPVAYDAMHRWLKPGGTMSHQIDFKSHGLADRWNGHWAYSDLLWTMIRGNRPYLLNRMPCSEHLTLLRGGGFELIHEHRAKTASDYTQANLAQRFRSMSDDDLTTSGVYLLATKNGSGAAQSRGA
jgi:SAM-dependent methyltransferase